MNMNLSKPREMATDREALGVAVHGVAKSWTWLIAKQQIAITICFMFSGTPKLGAYVLKIVIFSSWIGPLNIMSYPFFLL